MTHKTYGSQAKAVSMSWYRRRGQEPGNVSPLARNCKDKPILGQADFGLQMALAALGVDLDILVVQPVADDYDNNSGDDRRQKKKPDLKHRLGLCIRNGTRGSAF